MARVIAINSFISCFFQRPKRLGLLLTRFLTFDRFVQLYILATHVLPFRSLEAFVDGLAEGVPVLIHEWRLPSAVSHIRGVNESVQHTFFFGSQCQLTSSFPNHCYKKVCREFRPHHSMFSSKSPTFTTSWLSTRMNLLSPSIIVSRLLS